MNREDVIKTLLQTFHLNVAQRVVFVDHPLLSSELLKAIISIIEEEGQYPDWNEKDDFEGVLIQKQGLGYLVFYKAETRLGQYVLLKRKLYEKPQLAVEYSAIKMFGSDIDGIPVNWP